MGKSTPSPPRQPDPSVVAGQQTASNVNTAVANAWLNNTNQRTPQGSLTYRQTGTQNVGGIDVPTFEAIQELSPEQQKLYDTGTRTAQGYADLGEGYVSQIRDATKTPFSYAGMPTAPTALTAPGRMVAPTPTDVPQYNDAYQAQVYNRILDRQAPRDERDRAALQQRLANQGIPVGSEASNASWDDYNRGLNDFRAASELAAADEAGRRYGYELQGNQQGWGQRVDQFGLNLDANNVDWRQQRDVYDMQGLDRDRAINDALRLRSVPINEASALFSLGSGVQSPNFVNTPQSSIAPTDVSGIYANNYAGRMAQYNSQMQSNNAATGGLYGLGGTLLGAGLRYGLPLLAGSDVRMKENIRHIGHAHDGQRLYLFTYKGDPSTPHIGLMAQEVERIRPQAVVEIDGLKYVDYARAFGDE